MSDDVLKPIPAAFTGCSHDETCRNMAVMEALRIQLVAERAQHAETLDRLQMIDADCIQMGQERDVALAQVTVLARAMDGVKHLILGGWHEPLCPVGDTCAGCQVRHALAAPLVQAALAQPLQLKGGMAQPEVKA